jgi:DNA-binding LacI/PurR family transcriptional regulator
MTGQATIYDVARRAGVSPSTVSRAFHSPDLLRDETRDHVRDVARKLGYLPNRAAGGLRSGRTSTFGLVVPDVANPFFASLVKAAQARARSADYAVLLVDAEEDPRLEEQAIDAIAKQVDGAIIFAPRTTDANLRRAARATPLVLVNRPAGGIPSVVIDMVAGMREAVAHLHALGHRECLYLGGPRGSWSNRQRRTAFRDAARRLGMTASIAGPFQPHFESGLHAADHVLATSVTAVIAYNDLMALGVLARLASRGVSVPADISVIGFDDIPMAAMTSPPLTTVAMPTEAAGRAAVDLLQAIVNHDPDTTAGDEGRLKAALRVRGSTGPVSAPTSAAASG